MASSSGTSSVASLVQQNSGSEEDLQRLMMDQRKRRRMISNRESAKRSRMRKQKHMDDLVAQAAQLRTDKSQIISSLTVTTQHFLNIEEENAILRAQVAELSQRLESLNEIVNCFLNASSGGFGIAEEDYSVLGTSDDGFMSYNQWNWNDQYSMNLPVMASADILQC